MWETVSPICKKSVLGWNFIGFVCYKGARVDARQNKYRFDSQEIKDSELKGKLTNKD